jgi:hypothetical protein
VKPLPAPAPIPRAYAQLSRLVPVRPAAALLGARRALDRMRAARQARRDKLGGAT